MKFPFLKSGALPRIAVVCILATFLPLPAHGQISTLKKAATPEEPAKPAPPEKPEDVRRRLEQWLQERATSSPASMRPEPSPTPAKNSKAPAPKTPPEPDSPSSRPIQSS